MNTRNNEYKVINPSIFTPMNLRLETPARTVLARLQDTRQKQLDRKVSLKEIVTDVLLGRLSVD